MIKGTTCRSWLSVPTRWISRIEFVQIANHWFTYCPQTFPFVCFCGDISLAGLELYVDQAGFEVIEIPLPLPPSPENWDSRHVPSHPFSPFLPL